MNPARAIRTSTILAICVLTFRSSVASAVELSDVLAHSNRYDGQHVQLIGIARTYQDWFRLYADTSAAARSDRSKALLVRQSTLAGVGYTELDRQWVRVTGVMTSRPRRGYWPGNGVLLEHVEMLRDRPPPRIKSPYVLGVFYNATGRPIAINLRPDRIRGGIEFFLGADEADKIEIFEGGVVAAELIGPASLPLHQRQVGRSVAKGELKFRRLLPADYEYSPEWSDKRTFYYKIAGAAVERVPATEGKKWKIFGRNPSPI